MTAGSSSATAVPEVVSTATGASSAQAASEGKEGGASFLGKTPEPQRMRFREHGDEGGVAGAGADDDFAHADAQQRATTASARPRPLIGRPAFPSPGPGIGLAASAFMRRDRRLV